LQRWSDDDDNNPPPPIIEGMATRTMLAAMEIPPRAPPLHPPPMAQRLTEAGDMPGQQRARQRPL